MASASVTDIHWKQTQPSLDEQFHVLVFAEKPSRQQTADSSSSSIISSCTN